MNRNDWLGMLFYLLVSIFLGASVGFVCLFVKENSDRLAYYGGEWNKGDVVRGTVCCLVGYAVDVCVRCLLL